MAGIGPQEAGRYFEAHGAALVLYAHQWLGHGAAEDVVQDVFIRLMGLQTAPANVKAWLFAAVRNAAMSRLRRQKRRRYYEQIGQQRRPAWFEPRPEDLMDAAAAQAALEVLPPEQREPIVLRIWAGLTLQEISQITGLPVSTLFSRYQAGLAALRRKLESSPCGKTSE